MKALRELDLTHTAIKEVPQGVEELCTLRFLSIDGTYLMMVPGGLLLKLGNLEYLRFPIHMEVSVEEIVNLVKLDDFGGRLNDVRSLNLFIESSKPRDAFYHVQVGEYYKDGAGMDESYDRLVYLSKCNLKDEKVLGSGIEKLTIRECEGLSNCLLDVFPPTCYPVSLKALAIKRCGGIECVLTSSQGSQSRFLTLKSIELKGLQDFRQILKTELGAPPARAVFAHLIELKIENCNKIKNLGLPIWGVPNLDHLEISKCGEIEEVFEDEGEGPVPHPNLRRLSLVGLPRLKRICGATMICNSLKVIRFLQCPSLMEELPKLAMHLEFDVPTSPPPPGRDRGGFGLFWWSSLEIKVEREWWESLEWDNTSLLQLLQPFVTFEQQ